MSETFIGKISVIEPVGQAIEKTKRILFKPFDLGKWFVIGFCAWLATLLEGGGGGGGNMRGGSHGGRNFEGGFNHARHYILENLPWIIPTAVFVFLLAVGVMLLLAWLRSRGDFMFLHCVAENKAEVRLPWNKYGKQANSLFVFRLVLSLVAMACIIPLVLLTIAAVCLISSRSPAIVGGIAAIIVVVLMFLAMFIIFKLIGMFLRDFVVPVMYLRGCTCSQAWREVRELLRDNTGSFVLYTLFKIVIAIAIQAIIIAVVLGTCCMACCVLVIPYIGTVALLPILVFGRSYSLCYLAQYGDALNVFMQRPEVEVVSPPPAEGPVQ